MADSSDGAEVMGYSSSVVATIGRDASSATIEIPRGMVASSVTATVSVDDGVSGSEVRLFVGGTQVALVDGAQAVTTQVTADNLAADLTTVSSDGTSAVEISVRFVYGSESSSTTSSQEDACMAPSDQTVTLSNISVGLAGSADAVETVADFLSGPASAVYVVAEADSDQARTAALSAVASAAYVWDDATVEIVSTTPTDVSPAYPGAIRVISVEPGDQESTQQVSSLADGIPLLTLSGADVASAAAALGDAGIGLANASTTSGLAGSVTASDAVGDTLTLAELGQSTIQLSNSGASSAYIGVSQSDFGAPISAVTVHLVGTHSVLPEGVVATATIYWNDTLVDSFSLSEDIDVDRSFTVPSTLLSSSNSLQITLSTALSGSCWSGLIDYPVELDFDGGASTLQATRGQSADPGFSRFPQALGGTLQVAFDSGLDAQQSLAVGGVLIAALQAQQSSLLSVVEVSIEEATTSDSPVLVLGATAATAEALAAPLRLAEFRTVDSESRSLAVGVDDSFVALEAFEQNGRDIILLGGWSGSGASLDSLAGAIGNWIDDAEGGWLSLSDDLLLAGSNGVVNMSTGGVSPQQEAIDDYDPVGWVALGAICFVAVLLILGGIVRGARARRRAVRYVEREARARHPRDDSAR